MPRQGLCCARAYNNDNIVQTASAYYTSLYTGYAVNTYNVVHIWTEYTGLSGIRNLCILDPPLAVVSHTWYNNPFVDITLPACFVTTFGLQ